MAYDSKALLAMIGKRKLYRRWKRRFLAQTKRGEKLLSECLRTGEAEVVHDLRVTLRRTRLLALVGTPVLSKAPATEFRQWALKVALELGRLRDYDVIREWLKTHWPDAKHNRVVLAARQRIWRSTRPKLMVLSRLRGDQLFHGNPSTVRHGKLRKRFFRQSAKIRATLRQDATRFHQLDAGARHEFRRALRRLRYLRELSLRQRDQERDRRLKRLIAFQEALGEMQNCWVVRTFFSSPPGSESRREIARLAEVQEHKWLKRAERHLGEFLRQRDG